MLKFLRGATGMALLSGFLTVFSLTTQNFILIWLSYIPLFITLNKLSSKQAFKSGLFFGIAIAIAAFYWMIPGAERFTGSSIVYGIIAFVISSFFFCLFFGAVTWCFSRLKFEESRRSPLIFNSLLMACLFCVAEALLTYISSGFPWFDYHSGYPLSASLYTIQPAAFFGVHILTFIVIWVNYLAAAFIAKKQWIKLLFPAGIIAACIIAGYIMLQCFNNSLKPGKTVNIAILSENVAPEIKWNDTTGNLLAERLFDMNRVAVTLKPDIALWSESAIPWTYKKDDDMVKAILKITKPANITHILGINTEAGGSNMVYNSAYCMRPDGSVAGRYDKQVLLALIEKPLSGMLIPFMSSTGFTAQTGQYSDPLNTPYGKAGIIICNESAVPATAYNAVDKGAGFLCNLSNDGWFNNTYIVSLHFYNARLRAVETRKDMTVNSNMGYSGLIKASGEIAMQERSEQPIVKVVTVNPNNYNTLTVACPFLFVYFCGIGLVVLGFLRFARHLRVK